MVERLAVMLNFNLKQLCGPENKGLIVREGGKQTGRHTCMCTGRQAGICIHVYRQTGRNACVQADDRCKYTFMNHS